MSNDGAVSLSPGLVTNTVTTRAVNLLGIGTLALIEEGNVDDGTTYIALPFPVSFNGISYTDIYVCSNGYITFGFSATNYFVGPTIPAGPTLFIYGGDQHYQRVYAGSEDGNATFRIRWEGSYTGSGGTPGASPNIWEVTFDSAGNYKIDVGATGSASGVSAVSDGVSGNYLLTWDASAGNLGFDLTSAKLAGNYPTIVGTLSQSFAAGYSTDWRVLVTASTYSGGAHGNRVMVGEFQFREVAGTPELFATPTQASSSANNGSSFIASYAATNDGGPNAGPYWDSGDTPADPLWWRYSYPSPVKIAEYTIQADDVDGYGAPTAFQLQSLGIDGVTWTTVDTRTGVTGYGTDGVKTFTLGPASNSGAITLTPFDASGTLGSFGGGAVLTPFDASGVMLVVGGAVSILFPTLAGTMTSTITGGAIGAANIGDPTLSGTPVTPFTLTAVDHLGPTGVGTVNLGYDVNGDGTVIGTPWQLYSLLNSGVAPNIGDGDINLLYRIEISVDARIDPPMALLPYDVIGAMGFAGSSIDGAISVSFDVQAIGLTGNSGDGLMSLRPYDASGDFGVNGAALMAPFTLNAAMNVGAIGAAVSELNEYQVAGTAFASTTSTGDARIGLYTLSTVASASVSGNVGNGDVTVMLITETGTGGAGNVLRADITIPLLTLDAFGYASAIGTATISVPRLQVSGWMEGAASVAAIDFTTIVVNSRTNAVSTYSGLEANSFCQFNGVVLAATPNGIVALTGDTDNGAQIDAHVLSGVSDYQSSFNKRAVAGYMGYRADGNMTVTLFTDEQNEFTYNVIPREVQAIHPTKVTFGRGLTGRYWQWRLSNVLGADFQVEGFEMDINVLSRRI